MGRPTPEQWADARRRWEQGKASFGQLADDLDVHKSTVHRRKNREGWTENPASEERKAQTEAATEKRRETFAERREDEATAAADMARLTRLTVAQRIRLATDPNISPDARIPLDARAVRELAVAYGIFVDKAQLLAGEATARYESIGSVGPDERKRQALTIIDELEERRRNQAS